VVSEIPIADQLSEANNEFSDILLDPSKDQLDRVRFKIVPIILRTFPQVPALNLAF
jgi:hypothetical protein